ncbi:MAG TPA: universal stress protein [Thermoleophilaceae bacterium]|jgi:nucleotide-binding universal stress UspA family protein
MFKTIVVGTDGSDTAQRAVSKAAEIASLTGASLHVVSAYSGGPVQVGGGAEPEAKDWAIGADYNAEAVLQRTASRLRDNGIDVGEHAPKGDPADGIVEVATREKADLIVLGSVGMQGKRRLLGSVPNKVSHHAPCDVLIVHTA